MLSDYGIKIKTYRKRANLNEAELANLVGVDTKTLVMYESGKKRPPMEIMGKLSHILDIDTDVLFGFQPKKKW